MWASHRWALSVAGTFSCGWGLCGQSASPAGGGRLPGISGDASVPPCSAVPRGRGQEGRC